MNRIILIFLSNLLIWNVTAQESVKAFKKVIPVKKLSLVKPLEFEAGLYFYQAKSDTGIWDNTQNKIVTNHISDYSTLNSSKRFIVGSSTNKYQLIDLKKKTVALESKKPFWIYDNGDTNALVIGNAEFCGFLDITTGEINKRQISELGDKTGEVITWFHSDTLWTDSTEYMDWEFVEFVIPAYKVSEKSYQLFKRNTYLVLDYVGNDSIIVLKPEDGSHYKTMTGDMLWTDKWLVIRDNGKVLSRDDDGRTYYNLDFNVEIERFVMHELGVSHLSKILGKTVTRVDLLRTRVVSNNTGLYVYQLENKSYGIYSVYNERDLMEPVDFLFKVGEDIHRELGFSFYAVKEPYFGFFSTNYGWEVTPDKSNIQLLALSDGTYAYLADGMLYPKQGANWVLKDTGSRKASENDLKNSMVVHHITEINDKLLVSGRFSYRDDHDDAYYSNTAYLNEYGIIGYGADTTYLTGRLHSVEYFDDHYIVQHSNWNNAPKDLLILNEDLDTLKMPHKLRHSWIWNGMFLTNTGKKLVEYDLKNKKIKRVIGPAYQTRDFHVKHGYLLLGHNEYSRYDKRSGDYHFDIASIITAKGKMINLSGMVALDICQNDLAFVGQVPKNAEIKGSYTDFPIKRHFRPDRTAILDLKTGKRLTPWMNTLRVIGDKIYIGTDVDWDVPPTKISPAEFRDWASDNLK